MRWKMSASVIILASVPSFCNKLSKLVEICRSLHFLKGVGHFERKFQMEGGIGHQPLLVPEN